MELLEQRSPNPMPPAKPFGQAQAAAGAAPGPKQ
jgi:hypothetical protein